MKEKVAVYSPGALVGHKLRSSCDCGCHEGRLMHMFPCCTSVKGFDGFPALDEHGTPTQKLPNCPHCNEDELGVIHSELVLCYKCGWKMVRGNSVGATT